MKTTVFICLQEDNGDVEPGEVSRIGGHSRWKAVQRESKKTRDPSCFRAEVRGNTHHVLKTFEYQVHLSEMRPSLRQKCKKGHVQLRRDLFVPVPHVTQYLKAQSQSPGSSHHGSL